MKPISSIVFFLFLCLPLSLLAQSTDTEWDALMQELAEESVEDEGEEAWEAQLEELTELHEHPLDLNHATREQLSALPFLSEAAVDGILNYLALNAPMRSLGELRFIPALSLRERECLRLFVYVPQTTDFKTRQWRDTTWWGHAKHELTTRADIPLYNRAGWPWSRGIANRLRYTWQQGRHLDAGLRAETDAGEQMFTRSTPLWDSYGGHFQLKDLGPLKSVVIGDYKASFGQGLVLNNGLRFGKLSTSLWRTPEGIRPHRSADEVNYLRGAAATLAFARRWQFTALYSYRRFDATVAADNTFQTINPSGLHRSDSELARKGSLGSHTAAFHLATSLPLASPSFLSLGTTALYQYYDHQFRQGTQLYRQIYPEGYQFAAFGLDYSLRISRLYFSGETALSTALGSSSPALSTLNKATWRFTSNTQVALIQRYYGKHYFSPYAKAYGENSRVQNESGVTLQLDADRLGPIALRALFDYFYSPWPRYTMTRSSDGWEALLQTTYASRRGRTLLLRYNLKSKEQSDRRHYSHRFRATYSHALTARWTAALSSFLHHYHEPASSSTGLALVPRADYTSLSSRLRLSLFAVLFRTDDYNSRLCLYEPSLFQTFGLQQLYGHGQRLAATLRLRTADRRWTAQIKAGVTHYTDRSEISSGPLLIRSPWKADLQVVLHWQLR